MNRSQRHLIYYNNNRGKISERNREWYLRNHAKEKSPFGCCPHQLDSIEVQ